MTIDFNFGEHYHYSSSSFIIDLFTTFVGAFFGFLFALYLNRRAEQKIKKLELEKRRDLFLDKLNYLALFIESLIDTVNKQIKYFDDFSLKVKKSPLEIHMPELLATYDFDRLKNFSSNELLEAFTYFNRFNENRIKDYKNIFSHVDYLHRIFLDYEKQNEKHQLFVHKDQLFVRECLENTALKIGLKCKNIQYNNSENYSQDTEYKYLLFFVQKYSELTKMNLDFKLVRDEYFKPLHDSIFNNINDQDFSDSIYFELKKGMSRLINIEANSIRFSDDFKDCKNNVEDSLKYLTEIKEKISSINVP